jgi:hypothetical protein
MAHGFFLPVRTMALLPLYACMVLLGFSLATDGRQGDSNLTDGDNDNRLDACRAKNSTEQQRPTELIKQSFAVV